MTSKRGRRRRKVHVATGPQRIAGVRVSISVPAPWWVRRAVREDYAKTLLLDLSDEDRAAALLAARS